MTTHTDAGTKHRGFAIRINRRQNCMKIYTDGFCVVCDFIGECDVHVSIDHARQLDQFRCFECSNIDYGRAQILG